MTRGNKLGSIKIWAVTGGIAGLALFVFLKLHLELIQKVLFPKLTKAQAFKIIISFMFFTWSLVLFIVLISSKSRNSNSELNIHLRSPRSQQIIFPDIKGNWIIDLPSGQRITPPIATNGSINVGVFKAGDKIGLGLNAPGYKPVNPDSQYVFDGKPIYFAIHRSLGKIRGFIKETDGSSFINGASIIIGDTIVKSDEYGKFRIDLADSLQIENLNEFYTLIVVKEGFNTREVRYYPNGEVARINLTKSSGVN